MQQTGAVKPGQIRQVTPAAPAGGPTISGHIQAAAALAVFLAFTLWLYGASLNYGLMLDDAADLPRASGRTYAGIISAAGDSTYYRPLVFIIWKALFDLLGQHNLVLLHGLSLGVHSFNAFLVYLLGRRLASPAAGFAGALFFTSFHFSYQAVGVINSFFHLVLTLFALGSLLCYLKARDVALAGRPALLWLGSALVLFLAGCATHEFGVTLVVAILGLEVRDRLAGCPARWSWLGAYLAATAAFLAVWWLVPKWSTGWHASLSILQVNAGYFAQGLVFPVAPHLQGLARVVPLGNEGLIGVVAAASTIGGLLLVWRCGMASTYLVMLVWFAASLSPAWLLLAFHGYLVDSPRLMYYASAAAALGWGIVVTSWVNRAGKWRNPARISAALVVLAILFQNSLLVRQSNSLLALSGSATASVARATGDGADGRLLVVNFPAWFAPRDNPYLLGHIGYSFLPEYIGLNRLAYVATGRQREAETVFFTPISPRLDYNYGYHGSQVGLEELSQKARQAGGVYLTEYSQDEVKLRLVGAQRGDQGVDDEYLADFGQWVRLERVEYEAMAQGLEVELEWRSLQAQAGDYTVFVHLYGPDGQPVAQGDGYPLAGLLPPRLWDEGGVITDRRLVALPGLAAGDYTLATGWYDRNSGARAPARSPAGEPFLNDVVTLGTVTIR